MSIHKDHIAHRVFARRRAEQRTRQCEHEQCTESSAFKAITPGHAWFYCEDHVDEHADQLAERYEPLKIVNL